MKKIFVSLLLVFGLGTVALAQAPAPQAAPQVRVHGTVASLDGTVLTVNGPGGAMTKVALAPDARITTLSKVDLATLQSGRFVGVTAEPQPDGTLRAVEINLFPVGVKVGEGSHPWDYSPTSTMTNGTIDNIGSAIDKVQGNKMLVTYQGGQKTVVIPPNAMIVSNDPADKSALTPGAAVLVTATKLPDGSLSAVRISVGKNGLIPT